MTWKYYYAVSTKHSTRQTVGSHLESGGAVRNKRGASLGNAVGEGELEIGLEELLDVRATGVSRLFYLDDAEDLSEMIRSPVRRNREGAEAAYVDRPEARFDCCGK